MKVKFMPQDVELEIKPGQSVMDLAHEKDIFIKSICNGLPSCAECRVRVVDGEANVLPPSTKELNLIGTGYFIDQRRLSCQLLCFGDITVDLAEQLEKQKQGPRRLLGNRKVEASNAVSGNLIEQDDELKKMMAVPTREPEQRPENTGEREPRTQQRGGGEPSRHQGGGQQQGQNRQRDQRPRSQQRDQPRDQQRDQPRDQGRNQNQQRAKQNKSFRYRPGQKQD